MAVASTELNQGNRRKVTVSWLKKDQTPGQYDNAPDWSVTNPNVIGLVPIDNDNVYVRWLGQGDAEIVNKVDVLIGEGAVYREQRIAVRCNAPLGAEESAVTVGEEEPDPGNAPA